MYMRRSITAKTWCHDTFDERGETSHLSPSVFNVINGRPLRSMEMENAGFMHAESLYTKRNN